MLQILTIIFKRKGWIYTMTTNTLINILVIFCAVLWTTFLILLFIKVRNMAFQLKWYRKIILEKGLSAEEQSESSSYYFSDVYDRLEKIDKKLEYMEKKINDIYIEED